MTILNLRVTFTRRGRTGTIAIEAFNNNFMETPNELNRPENLPCLSWRVVRGMGMEEDASADAGGRASPGDADLYGSWRARASRQPVDRSRDPHSRIFSTSSIMRICATSCWSATAMAAWSRPASPTARAIASPIDLFDAFVPEDGQSLLDLTEPARQHMQELAKAGDGWRVPPNPTPPDTPPADIEWLTGAPRRYADQMLRDEAQAARRQADIAAQLYLCHAHRAGGYVWTVCQDGQSRAGWRYYEIDASHSPNVTAPEALMTLLQKIVA